MRNNLCIAVVLAIAFTFGCGKNNSADTQKSTTTPQNTATPPQSASATGGLKVDLKVDPAEPNPNRSTKFSATLKDADGKPVKGAEVSVALVMKEMDMGKNEFKLADQGDGRYEGEGKFGMAGEWNAVVTARQADKSASQTFPVKSVMPKPASH